MRWRHGTTIYDRARATPRCDDSMLDVLHILWGRKESTLTLFYRTEPNLRDNAAAETTRLDLDLLQSM